MTRLEDLPAAMRAQAEALLELQALRATSTVRTCRDGKTIAARKPKATPNQVKGLSKGESELSLMIKSAGLPDPVREFVFHPKRKWRADFAWPAKMLLVEIEGGIWSSGRHNRGAGFQADLDKYNAAHDLGYMVRRFSTADVVSGRVIEVLKRLLA